MRIGILHREDIGDVRKLSGTPFYMVQSLRRHFPDVVYLGPDQSRTTRWIEFAGKALNRLLYPLVRKRLITDHNPLLRWRLGRVFQPRVDATPCDLIFAPFASVELSAIHTETPVVYLSDLTWASIIDYYPATSNLAGWTLTQGYKIEEAAMGRAAALVFPSAWAAESAVQQHGMDPERVHVIALGANFASEDVPTRDLAVQHPLEGPVKLLWVGVSWERKDGKLAFDCLQELLRMGIPATLTVCGCVPPPGFAHESVRVVGFLNKNDPAQRRQMSDLYLEANFLLFPTLAEAVGVVTCEASAHGLPALVRETGGSGSVVAEGRNGFLLPYTAGAAEYAARIAACVRSPQRYAELVRDSRTEYEQRLNWNHWGDEAARIFRDVAAAHAAARPRNHVEAIS